MTTQLSDKVISIEQKNLAHATNSPGFRRDCPQALYKCTNSYMLPIIQNPNYTNVHY